MGKQENIDKLFEDTLHGYQEAPPADAWDAIQNRMAGEKRKKRAFVFRLAAASVAILIAFGAGYTYKDWKTNSTIGDNPIVVEPNPVNDALTTTPEAATPVVDATTEVNTANDNTIASQDTELANQQSSTQSNINEGTTEYKNANQNTTIADATNGVNETQQPNTPVNNANEIYRDNLADNPSPSIAINELNGNDSSNNQNQPVIADITQPVNKTDTNNVPDLIIDPKYKKNLTPIADARWAMGAVATPLYSFRNASDLPNDNSANTLAATDNRNNERAIVAYAGGINVNYKASSRWEIQSGIYYSRQGIQTNDLNVVADATPGSVNSTVDLNNNNFSANTSTGNVPLGTSGGTIGVVGFTTTEESGVNRAVVNTDATLVQNFEYFEIPVLVKYNLIQKKVGVHLTGGLSANILSANYAYVEANGNRQSVGETENIRDINYSGVVGVGMNYSITKKLSFTLEPTLRYSITPINKEADINSFLYSMGVFTGLSYNF